MDLQTLLKDKRSQILAVAAHHGASNVRIFGSLARGEEDEHSDIDLLVSFDPDRSLLDHAALLIEMESLLGCRVDVVSDRGLRPRVREHVLRDAVAL
jgi:uncharacterized protein